MVKEWIEEFAKAVCPSAPELLLTTGEQNILMAATAEKDKEIDNLKADAINADMADGCLRLIGEAIGQLGEDVSNTPAMMYPEAINNLCATRNREIERLRKSNAEMLTDAMALEEIMKKAYRILEYVPSDGFYDVSGEDGLEQVEVEYIVPEIEARLAAWREKYGGG